MNIYVGNLSFDVTDDSLKAAFEAFGTVDSAKVIINKFNGKSRGFGFVEMSNEDEGRAAISELDGKDIQGREVKVNEARPRTDDQGGQ